jgi:hypothetical protein
VKIENQKIIAHYWASFSAPDPVLLAWPSGTVAQPALRTLALRGHHAHHAGGGALAGSPALTGRGQGPAREHHGLSGVAPGKVGWRDSH